MKGHKFIKISTDELLDGTGVIVNLDYKTDKIIICRDLKEITVFPYVDDDQKTEDVNLLWLTKKNIERVDFVNFLLEEHKKNTTIQF